MGEVSEANEAGNPVLDDVACHWGPGDLLRYPLPYQITNPLHPGKSRGVAAGKLLLGGMGGAGKSASRVGRRGKLPWGAGCSGAGSLGGYGEGWE